MILGSNKSRIVIITIIAVIVLILIIFSIPFNTVSFDTTETYQETEVKKEPYTATESYVSSETIEKEDTIYDGSPDSVYSGVNVPFSITQSNSHLVGRFDLPSPGDFYVYSSADNIEYELFGANGNIDVPLPKGEYRALLRERTYAGKPLYLNLKVKWTETDEVTKQREVTKYREVPVKVDKQRTVTQYKKVSFWEIIFKN